MSNVIDSTHSATDWFDISWCVEPPSFIIRGSWTIAGGGIVMDVSNKAYVQDYTRVAADYRTLPDDLYTAGPTLPREVPVNMARVIRFRNTGAITGIATVEFPPAVNSAGARQEIVAEPGKSGAA